VSDRPARILRVVTRLNTGGPARHLATLTQALDPVRYEQRLVAGREGPGEGSMRSFVDLPRSVDCDYDRHAGRRDRDAGGLSSEEQDRIGRLLLHELADDEQGTRKFETSQDLLGKLAAEARAGRTDTPVSARLAATLDSKRLANRRGDHGISGSRGPVPKCFQRHPRACELLWLIAHRHTPTGGWSCGVRPEIGPCLRCGAWQPSRRSADD
jgi:hypothetical protein